jgi:hypothetical protein
MIWKWAYINSTDVTIEHKEPFCTQYIQRQVSLKYEKNDGYFMWRLMYIYDSISLKS